MQASERFRSARWPFGPAQRRAAMLLAGFGVFATLWLVHLASTHATVPGDSLEQLTWVRSMQWGYHKHPPLPTWLIWAPVRVLGLSPTVIYLAGATCVLATAAVLWRIVKAARGRRAALLTVLAVLCVTYCNGRLHYYNHNTVLMVAVVASAWMTCLALRRDGWPAVAAWCGLGLAIGLGLLSKYQMVLVLPPLAWVVVRSGAWRMASHRAGLVLAGGVAALVFLPHWMWLLSHDFAPFTYARHSALHQPLPWAERPLATLNWMADQMGNRAAPAWLLLALVVAWIKARTHAARLGPDAAAARMQPDAPAAPQPMALRVIVAWGTLPLVGMAVIGLMGGVRMQMQWGTAFLPLAVAAVAVRLIRPETFAALRWPAVVISFVAVQALLLAVDYGVARPREPYHPGHLWRHFPSDALAAQLGPAARERLGRLPAVIIGPAREAGAIAMKLDNRPLVLIDGNPLTSPWVPADAVARCGALELTLDMQRPGFQPVKPASIGLAWRVVMPTSDAGCRLR